MALRDRILGRDPAVSVQTKAIRAHGLTEGDRYDGPVAFCDGHEVDFRRGFYALTPDGKAFALPLLRLVSVDDAPGDEYDDACHYEVAGPNDHSHRIAPERIVQLDALVEGDASIEGDHLR